MSMLVVLAAASGFVVTPPVGRMASPAAAMMPARVAMAPSMQLFGQKEKTEAKVGGKKAEGEEDEGKALMQKVKDAGVAGVISYIFWEWAFWGVSVPVALFGFREVTGAWPDFQNQDDLAKLGAEAFAFVNVARFAVPLRISLALGTTPWVKENIVDKFNLDKDKKK